MAWGRVMGRALEPGGKQGFRGGMMAMEKAELELLLPSRATAKDRAGPQ